MDTDLASLELSAAQFERISLLMYRLCGINLHHGKEELVKARLMKRLRKLGLSSFQHYLRYIERDKSGQELAIMIDALTTNKTSFFREPQHFDYLRRQILPRLMKRRIRVWSAGCSSGEEPFSIAILLREELSGIDRKDVRILGTDISKRMLEVARAAVYEQEALRDVPPQLLLKYFTCVQTKPPRTYRVNDTVSVMVRLARLNLMGEWPMRGPFDVIFCRNVMIYFDKNTRQELIHRFWELLQPGGLLFLGHSESLTALSHQFRYVQPAIYIK